MARRSASGSRARWARASPASCTSSMSRRSACTSATTSGCWPRSSTCAISATPCWSSSTTRKPSARRTTCSTSAPAPACTAARWSRRARRPTSSTNTDSLTGKYLSGRKKIALPTLRTPRDPKRTIQVIGARGNNLKNVDAEFPLGLFTCVTGVSGSGKSTLVNDTLFTHANHKLNGTVMDMAPCDEITRARGNRPHHRHRPEPHRPHAALESRPPTPACSARCARLFAEVPEARTRGYDAGPLQLQREGRTLRGLPGRRPHQGGDALPARTSTCPATSARASATTARRSRSAGAARTSTKCST